MPVNNEHPLLFGYAICFDALSWRSHAFEHSAEDDTTPVAPREAIVVPSHSVSAADVESMLAYTVPQVSENPSSDQQAERLSSPQPSWGFTAPMLRPVPGCASYWRGLLWYIITSCTFHSSSPDEAEIRAPSSRCSLSTVCVPCFGASRSRAGNATRRASRSHALLHLSAKRTRMQFSDR